MTSNSVTKQAVEMIKKGDTENARALLEDFVQHEPNNERAYFLLAHTASNKEQAEFYLKRVLSINPDNEKAQERLEKISSIREKSQSTSSPAKVRKSNTILYLFLGGIITLLFSVTLLLGGIWSQNKKNLNNLSNETDGDLSIATSVPLPPDTKPDAKIQSVEKWEYMEFRISCRDSYCIVYSVNDYSRVEEVPSRVDVLNELGKEGWEVSYTDSGDNLTILFGLKRPIIEKPSTQN